MVFDAWKQWRIERKSTGSEEDTGWTPYYSHRRFQHEFLEFVESYYLPEMANTPAAIAAIARAESAPVRHQGQRIIEETDQLEESTVPYVIDSLFVVDLEVDYKELISSLRNKTDLSHVSSCNATVIFTNAGDDLNVWQLSPLAGVLLNLCDGQRTVADITREFSSLETGLTEIPADKVCLFGLGQLLDDGFIALSAN